METNLKNCHPLLDLAYSYYLPCMTIVGVIGNVFCCLVFTNSYLRTRSSTYYLWTLSAADLSYLSCIFVFWTSSKFHVPKFEDEWLCQVIAYVGSVSSFVSVWIIVAFTSERYIAVHYPLQRSRLCTIKRAKITIFILIAISILLNAYSFVTDGIIQTVNGAFCELRKSYRNFLLVFNLVDTLITLVIPVLLIITMNARIMKHLTTFNTTFTRCPQLHSKSIDYSLLSSTWNGNRRSLVASSLIESDPGSSFTSGRNRSQSCTIAMLSKMSKTPSATSRLSSLRTASIAGSSATAIQAQQKITKILLLISTVYLLLNTPSYALRWYIFQEYTWKNEDPTDQIWCFQQMAIILRNTNFGINFLLYNVCGATFRKCFDQLLRKYVNKIRRYFAWCDF